ncbi:DUF4221 family protein [Pleomorphovibrio marinus]|uniref:DUF4221 family protein n=1 Tax=Pleomorphovibrio marinus TaxID=2164132 RepID=UPI000E0C55F6|nr:DUF4221 family protein [Pleomorphovibrio marinus]
MVFSKFYRKFSYLCLIGTLWACDNKSTVRHVLEREAIISIDTVMIDSKGEFLYLNDELRQSTLSSDKRFLYNFNERESSIEQINLDELCLDELLIFDRDGPNGIGSLISNIQLAGEGRMLIWSLRGAGIFGLQGSRLSSVELSPVEDVFSNGYHYSLRTFKENFNNIFGLTINWDSHSYFFWKLNPENGQLKNYNLSEFDKVKSFVLQQMDGARVVRGNLPGVFLSDDSDKLFLSNEVSNDIYIYDPKLDSLIHYALPHNSIPQIKVNVTFPKAESQEEMNKLLTDFKEDINFSKLNWDQEAKLFYRFSYKEKFTRSMDIGGSPVPSSSEVFLSVWDSELNLLSEQQVQGLTETPKTHFVKDGKIWVFVNVEDEMGFLRLSLDL